MAFGKIGVKGRGLGPRADVELLVDPPNERIHRRQADVHQPGDLLVQVPLCEQSQQLVFALRQLGGARSREQVPDDSRDLLGEDHSAHDEDEHAEGLS